MTRKIAALALAALLALSSTCLSEGSEPEPSPAAEPETEVSAPAAEALAEPEVREEEPSSGEEAPEASGDAGNSEDAGDEGGDSSETGEANKDGGDPDTDTGETGEGDTGEGGDSGNGDAKEGNPDGGDSEGEASEGDGFEGDNPDEGDGNPEGDNPDEGEGSPEGDNSDEDVENPDADNPDEDVESSEDDSPDEDVENPEEGDPIPTTLAIEVATAGAVQAEGGAWQIPYASPEDAISFRWTAIEGAQYDWSVADGSGSCVNSGSQAESALSLRAQDYMEGNYTLTVAATVGEETLCASLRFALAQAQPPQEERPERPGFGGRPSGGFGGRPSGSSGGARPSGDAAEESAPEEEQDFHVTPGVALTGSHAAGTKDMTPYGAALLSLPDEPVAALTLSGSEPDVHRADGGSFTAVLEEEALTLACDDAAAQWCINPLTLKALCCSGVTALRLNFGEQSVALPTDFEFTGAVYASYRARGYVSKDFELRVSLNGIAAVVDGVTYALSDAYELTEM